MSYFHLIIYNIAVIATRLTTLTIFLFNNDMTIPTIANHHFASIPKWQTGKIQIQDQQ
jgi:hypothetical protein